MRVLGVVAAVAVLAVPALVAADEAGHVVSGTIDGVDSAAKTVSVKTADGVEHTFKITGDTAVAGSKDVAGATTDAAKATALGAKKGSQAVVQYTEEGGKETAHGIKVLGAESVKAASGTVTAVDRGARTITVKTAEGTEATYHVASEGVVDAGKGTAKGGEIVGEESALGVEVGSKVTVHYTVEGGKSVVHGIEHLF